jgi:diguanylate cyclase (GGDEF)-like protein
MPVSTACLGARVVSPNRFTKALARRAKVSWRDRPTRYDIEALQANIARVGLVIHVRWALVAVLSVFTLLGVWVYGAEVPWSELAPNIRIPALAVGFVCLYNAYYHLTYKRLGNIAFLNHAQLLFDVIVVTVLVYYSGGVNSWFYAMYALFVLEAAFILPKSRDAWIIAGFSALAYGVVVWGEYLGLLAHVEVPFTYGELHLNWTYVTVRYLWQVTMLGGIAMVATLMTSEMRSREKQLAESSIVDEKTGLYDRKYFLRSLSSEVLRAERDARPFAVLMLDIDDLARFNEVFGIARGDAMIHSVADTLASTLEECCTAGSYETNVLSRFGGEEFAVLLVEGIAGGSPGPQDALAVGEVLRAAVESLRLEDASVTISVGVASYPESGPTPDTLLSAADEALHASSTSGGNRISLAGSAA